MLACTPTNTALFLLIHRVTDAPAGAYYSSIVGTDYDWKHRTVAQAHLNNRVVPWPRGKVSGEL